ncbi:hypothetical protein, partial [Mesorhizobium sp. f-mel]
MLNQNCDDLGIPRLLQISSRSSHGFSFCPPLDKDGHLDLPEGKYPQLDLNQIWPVNRIFSISRRPCCCGHVLSSASGKRPAPETGAGFA